MMYYTNCIADWYSYLNQLDFVDFTSVYSTENIDWLDSLYLQL